jgi:hypothetical protein
LRITIAPGQLDKEDVLVKTALTLVLAALCGIGLSGNTRAAAQQPTPSNPVYTAIQEPTVGGGAATSASPTAPVTATPAPAANSPVDTRLLDNCLWDNAPIGACCAKCGGGSCGPSDWYLEQDVRILNRSRPRETGIGYEFSTGAMNTIGNQVLNSRTATPNISAVWGMTFGHYFARDSLNRDHFIEFSFWGLNNWRDEASYNGHRISILNSAGEKKSEQGDLYSQYATKEVLESTASSVTVPILNGVYFPGFDKADRQTTTYISSTNNFEINGRISPRSRQDRNILHPNGKWQRECQPGMYMSYLYGIRFLQINEAFRFHSESRIDTYDPTSGSLIDSREDTGDYDIVTHNNLLGFQFGAEMMFRQCRWSWGVRAKVGPYVNFCDQVSNINSVSTDPTAVEPYYRRLSWSKHSAAVVGELGFEATYKFRPNLVGHVGYDFMWVPGVALAPEQLQFDTEPTNKINANGLAFFNGITMGLEWLW